jgi:hypothetical protein
MRQVIVDAPGNGRNGRIVILNDDVKTAREIAGGSCIESDKGLFAQKTTRLLPARGRAAPLWITAAFLATTWASETQGFPEARHARADAIANTRHAIAARNGDFGGTAGDHDFETVQASRFGDKSVLVAQATTGDTEELQKALEQEHRRSELLTRELTIARHLEMLLTLHKALAESARFNHVSESEYAESRKSLQQERDRLQPASESGAAELCKSLQGDRVDRLEQDLAAAKRDVETQTALAAKANDDATQLKQAAESDAAELKKSLQQERERAERLEQGLAAAQRDVETQTALATKANDDTTQLKQAAESDAAELKKSLQQERERAERLQQDLAAARRDIETQTALATKANDDTTQLKQAAESGAAELKELKKSLQQERERAERLQQDLAAARRDVETQTALAIEASDEAGQLKQVAENGSSGELKRSLQKEHERAESLAQELSMARTEIYAYEAQARTASEQATDAKQATESTAELRKSLQQERERAERLEQDLVAARGDVETQKALAIKASDEAGQLKQVAENGSAELKRSLQKEHERAESLAQDLSMARTEIYAYEAQARKASEQAADLKQAAESGAAELRSSLQQERERAERLEQDLAAARRDVEMRAVLAVKAVAEAVRLKQAADDSSVEFRRSFQEERDRAARLERELTSERNKKDVPAVTTAGQVTRDEKLDAEATKPVAADQVTVAEARGEAQLAPEDAAQVARLAARASVLLGQGNIGSARMVLERAAEMGSAQASFTLAETYDPLILPKWGTYGTRGDAAKARDLYAKAQARGIKEATERLDALRP